LGGTRLRCPDIEASDKTDYKEPHAQSQPDLISALKPLGILAL